jgi:type II secretory pathway predicted ATPase ExeA
VRRRRRARHRQEHRQASARATRPEEADHSRRRTLHTYHSVLRILCEAFQIETEGRDHRCEKRLIEEAHRINHAGKMLAPIIDDAHLIDIRDLRRLRLLFEDFPKNHNLILVAQPELLTKLALSPNDDLQSRVTYSVLIPKLAPDDLTRFIHAELDRAGLPHSTFTSEALALIVRSSEGLLRRIRNLCLGALIEAVRDRTKTIDLKQVNRVLLQPHWREQRDHS